MFNTIRHFVYKFIKKFIRRFKTFDAVVYELVKDHESNINFDRSQLYYIREKTNKGYRLYLGSNFTCNYLRQCDISKVLAVYEIRDNVLYYKDSENSYSYLTDIPDDAYNILHSRLIIEQGARENV